MRVAKYLRPLSGDNLPQRLVVFDCEAQIERAGAVQRQSFALAVCEFIRRNRAGDWLVVDRRDYHDAAALWSDVCSFCPPRRRVVAWCHNLSYDLRVSRALAELPALGLALDGIALGTDTSWATFRDSQRAVTFADLFAWLPTSLEVIGADVGIATVPVDWRRAGADALLERCRRDVEITRTAVLELLRLVGEHGLGPWRPTGAGQSHAAWRRRFLDHELLVHDSEAALEAERRAMWTGRCEAWRWGHVAEPGIAEYDLELAYANIAASCAVPARLVGARGPVHPSDLARLIGDYAVLAECEVTTAAELVPAAHGKLIHWPVGTFDTTLWDPELLLCHERRARVRVRRCRLYQREPALAGMSRWLLAQLAHTSPDVTPVQRRALKHWARTLIGRCALRYPSWERFCDLDDFGLRVGELHDLDTGERTDTLHVGHELFTLSQLREADSSLPQITGWVMSEARARLWRLIELAGTEHVLYCDTDSLVVDAEGAAVLDAAIDAGAADTLRRKGAYREARILGPRQLQLGHQRRLAGISKSARSRGGGRFDGQVWRSLRESLARNEGTTVVLEQHTWELQATDNRRHHLPGGATAPHRVG